jgi:predicted amidohydrolase YtcJ
MKTTVRWAASCIAVICSLSGCESDTAPGDELILYNGTVYTVDDKQPTAEAVAVRDGIIVAVGTYEDVRASVGTHAIKLDIDRKFLLPGLVDSHNHAIKGGERLLTADVGDILLSASELVEFVGVAVENGTATRGDAIHITGLHSSQWSHITTLDSLFNSGAYAAGPVMLVGTDGHTAWCNNEALRRAGITYQTVNAMPPGERLYFGISAGGEPNGFLKESAIKRVARFLPPSRISHFNAAKAGVRHLNSLGITAWLDPSAGSVEDKFDNPFLSAYDSLARTEGLTAHVVATVVASVNDPVEPQVELLQHLQSRYRTHIRVIGFKVFADGVLEYPTQTAAVSIPYTNSGARGSLMVDPDKFKNFISVADRNGMVVHTHAIGDRAITVTLDAVESARVQNQSDTLPHTITHLQVIVPHDIPRFAALNVMPSMQLLWANADHYTVELVQPYLDPSLYVQQYPARSLANASAVLCGASDWPVSSANPFEAIAVAETRKGSMGVLNESEVVEREEMIRAYTIHAARSMLLDQWSGSITVGKKADFVLVDRDVFLVSSDVIRDTKVIWTMFAGNIIYDAQKMEASSP